MAVDTHARRPVDVAVADVAAERKPNRSRRYETYAICAIGVGLGYIVAHDGTPIWQATRLLVVLATVAAILGAINGRRPLVRTTVALAAASIAIPIGLGVGGPHLAKTGLSNLTVAGLAVFLGGVVAFVAGVVDLLRARRRLFSIPTAIGAALTVLVLTWSLGQAVAATNVPRPEVGSTTPANRGLAFRDVEFPATDGVVLSGWYIASRNGAAVVLLHGAGSTRSNVLRHAVVLARNGYGVLLYDARGHGRSEGRAMDFGWFGDHDIGGAVTFLARQTGVESNRIAAVGMSMGGEEAVGAAASIEGVRAVVAEGATNRVAGDKAWLSDEFGVRGALSERVEGLTYAFADLLTSASPPITLHDAVRVAAPRPFLLIAAGDLPDEARAARFIQRGSPATVEVWVAPKTGHTNALTTHPDEWEHRVVTFLDDALGR